MRLSSLAIASLLVFSANSWAARDFTPQAGTWIVSSEIDGKPGRGLAIDVQGNTFFMQVFGYEKNGDATFYTATGQLDGNSITAPLVRYTGGRSFGSEARDGVEDSSPGDVTVSFSNGLKGSVQFPGEAPAAMERFAIKEFTPSISNPLAQVGQRGLHLLILDKDLQFKQYRSAMLQRDGQGQPVLVEHPGSSAMGNVLPCSLEPDEGQFVCSAADSGSDIDSLRFRMVGGQLAGQITMKETPTQQLTVIGQSDSAMDSGLRERQQQNYWYIVVPGATVTGIVTTHSHQLMPVNGTWMVQDELTGKPGRGLALDVQNSTMVLQVFNYSANGQPTFHMGSGTYGSAGPDTLASRAEFALNQYAGGRSLGGPAQSAHPVADAGPVRIDLALNREQPTPHFSQRGTVTFPGEAPKAIVRMRLDNQPSLADKLFGEWYMPAQDIHLVFNQESNGVVTSSDGSVRCEQKDPTRVDLVSCNKVSTGVDGTTNTVLSLMLPLLNQGSNWIQIRDRFGNLQGLGNID
ncbi:hypothetical protein [Comamonas koreensis]|uniref:Phytase-like domain-containing protein n=1 Tax=Comamonas koreensis TaxID=160825 RepID=A0AAW4XRY0_9BURK|nr:hypothetical protein [Comamonas koreensis]MCD2163664.1 hypothetical protein [Comamonas koreensis]